MYVLADNYVLLQKLMEKKYNESIIRSVATVTQIFRVFACVADECRQLAAHAAKGTTNTINPLFKGERLLSYVCSLADSVKRRRPYTETKIPGLDLSTLPKDETEGDPSQADFAASSYAGKFSAREEKTIGEDGGFYTDMFRTLLSKST